MMESSGFEQFMELNAKYVSNNNKGLNQSINVSK